MKPAGHVRWWTGGFAAVLTFGMSFACSSTHEYVWVQDLPEQDETPRIRVGDTMSVLVKGQESLSGDFPVREAERRAGDPPALIAGADAIRRVLGWQPRYDDLELIVRTALDWERRLQPATGRN